MERASKAAWLFIFITRLMSVVLLPCCLPAKDGWLVSRDVQGELRQKWSYWMVKKSGDTGGKKHESRGEHEGDVMENPKGTKRDALLDERWQMPCKGKLPAHSGYTLWRKKWSV